MGNGSIKGYLARPKSVLDMKLPGVLIVHENRGLNPTWKTSRGASP